MGLNTDTPATQAVAASGVDHRLVEFGRVGSVEEAAAARNIEVHRLLKTIVVRESEGRYLLVLVPGDRVIDWGKLRRFLGVSRLSLPGADEAFEATGYERGTITPFGVTSAWPVIADETIVDKGEVSVGGGRHGLAVHLDAADLVTAVDARIADVTRIAS